MFKTDKTDGGLIVHLTGEKTDKISSVIVLDIKGSPEVPNQNIIQNDTGILILNPEQSDLENRGYVSSNHAKLIRNPEFSYITWKETRTWMEWPVEINSDTDFDIYATMATTNANNKIIIEIGEENKEYNLPDTKGLDSFQKLRIGSISIPEGTTTLLVKGKSENWNECYMSNIELIPVK